MVEKFVDATASRKVELAVGELDSLSVPPCVAVQYLSRLLQGGFTPAAVADIIEAEPALAAGIFSLAQRQGAGPVRQRHAVRLVLDRLDANDVRDTLLKTKVTAGFEIEFAEEQPASPDRKDLILHSLAVACGARRIAEAADAGIDPQLAYGAGLLHDIGKLALQDIMPKSLAAIVKEAEAAHASLHTIEHQHLGTDHALLGRQLAQRWRLPDPVVLAIWLHHRDASGLFDTVPEALLAVFVRAADSIARRAGIGQSGSFDAPEPLEGLAAAVDVPVETLQQIRDELPQEVKRRSGPLGLETPHATARYCDLLQSAAADLSERNMQLTRAGQALQTAAGYLDFAREFLRGVRANVSAVDVAEDFARRWQRFFQTGAVCLYLTAGVRDGALDAAVVEALGHSHKTVLDVPADGFLVPRALVGRFALLDVRDHLDWLLDQLEVDFNRDGAKLLPLFSDGQPVGVVVFELNYPADAGLFAEKFEMAASMAGSILGLALTKERQEHFAERLTQSNGKSRRPSEPRPAGTSVETLAEMAAGVAHELNNPLSVIAGRAQLLAQAEDDGQKRHVLDVIGENAREASGVVDDLMIFAQPPPPRPSVTPVGQIIEEAVELARQKTGAEHVNAQIHVAPGARGVFVDSAQIASAVANVVTNALESYPDRTGPVKITAEPAGAGLRLQISDLGCGMDAETLRKAAAPFFSAKPAGRQRGMGLALASRLLQLNRATLSLESQPGRGTTATITLPYEQPRNRSMK
jgi:putative nucleotidyltransferase with HDIG domain